MPPKKPQTKIEAAAEARAASPSPSSATLTRKVKGRATIRFRKLSESEQNPSNPHVERLQYTLNHFPDYDLTSRSDFVNEPGIAQNIGGRTYKKVVTKRLETERDYLQESDGSSPTASVAEASAADITQMPDQFLMKKNAREAARDFGLGKTPSREMNLNLNHEESFREICALRLFQAIFQDTSTTPPEMKIVLSDFNTKKVYNTGKGNFTKVYIASRKIEELPFDIARLSVENTTKLRDLESTNQKIIDQLCEQIVVQCILSNADAIKLDNFYVSNEKVFQFDFGDARQNEKFSPDPLCILDQIRNHRDGNASASVKATFDTKNKSYQTAISYFSKHISPKHILAVIEKLQNIEEDLLWHIAYVYTYGDEKEKKLYADCLVARVRNFIKLKDSMESLQNPSNLLDDKDSLEDQSAKSDTMTSDGEATEEELENPLIGTSIRAHLANSDEFFEQHEEDQIMPQLDQIFAEAEVILNAENNDVEDNDVESQTTSGSSSSSSSEENSSDEEDDKDDEEEKIIDLTAFQEYCNNFSKICESLEKEIILPIQLQEELPEGLDQSVRIDVQISQVQQIKSRVKNFKTWFVHLFSEEGSCDITGNKDLLAQVTKEQLEISELFNSFLTHYYAHQELKKVSKKEYHYDKAKDAEMRSFFASIGVDTKYEPSPDLAGTLERIASFDPTKKAASMHK